MSQNTIPSNEPLNWQDEALAVIHDIKNHVSEMKLSDKLNTDELKSTGIFMNLTTLEQEKFCIRMSGGGFEIVGRGYDTLYGTEVEQGEQQMYETPYSLLTAVSKLYIQSFGDGLVDALKNIKN